MRLDAVGTPHIADSDVISIHQAGHVELVDANSDGPVVMSLVQEKVLLARPAVHRKQRDSTQCNTMQHNATSLEDVVGVAAGAPQCNAKGKCQGDGCVRT